MNFSRRDTILMALGAAAAVSLPVSVRAAVEDAIAAFTDGAEVMNEGITLTVPEIAENGNTVPVEVSADGAESIIVLAAGNPTPSVATFNFGPMAGAQMASTRMRLAGTQDVIAIAKMPDGSFAQASQEVKVTIGGCGG